MFKLKKNLFIFLLLINLNNLNFMQLEKTDQIDKIINLNGKILKKFILTIFNEELGLKKLDDFFPDKYFSKEINNEKYTLKNKNNHVYFLKEYFVVNHQKKSKTIMSLILNKKNNDILFCKIDNKKNEDLDIFKIIDMFIILFKNQINFYKKQCNEDKNVLDNNFKLIIENMKDYKI